MITLALDASTYTGTVAVLRGLEVVADANAAMRGRDTEALMPAVAAALTSAGVSPRDLDRVVCGSGPGSFTSLRIAASIAKGISFAVGCPLFAISSLALIVTADGEPRAGRNLAVLDALRGDAYVGGYSISVNGDVEVVLPEQLVPQAEVPRLAESLGAVTVGPGQAIDRMPHARGVRALGALIEASGPVELGSWEPHYGRKAEAQARWEATHGQPLPSGGNA